MMDLPDYSSWLGREERSQEALGATIPSRLVALLDRPFHDWTDGEAIPAHWYVHLFGTTAAQSTLGPDGHPPKGNLLPPVAWPRRMFAGRRVEFSGNLRIGDRVERISRVAAMTPKTGRSGPMFFVTLRHELQTAGSLAVVEEQDIVYRPAVSPDAGAPPAQEASAPVLPAATVSRVVTPDPTMLFRYSALMNNAHRIHYDAAYAREVEGFPALVVNGGLTTLLLWELAVDSFGVSLRRSSTRNLKPLFVNRPIRLNLAPGDGEAGFVAWAEDDTGAVAVRAELEVSK